MNKIFSITLITGVLQLFVGCAVGMLPPPLIPWYRGLVTAHIEFTANGVMLIALALVLRYMKLSMSLLWLWCIMLQVGTWTNGMSALAAAFSGNSSPMFSTVNKLFPPPNGTDNQLVSALLIICGLTILAGLSLTLIGIWNGRNSHKIVEGS